MGDGFSTERYRQSERRKALDWLASREVPTLASDQLFRTYSQGAYPTTVGKVHACHPCEISNVEAEGESGTISEDTTATCYVLNLGPQVPAVGDYLDADSIDGRWVANFFKPATGPPTVATPECPCNPGPAVIYAYSTRPDLNSNIFPSGVVLRYQATPSAYAALLLPSNIYLSDGSYTEPSHGDTFRVYLACTGGQYAWHRLFVTSFFGSPLLDLSRYTWTPGLDGNPCSPYYQLRGLIYTGGNTAGKMYLSAIDGDWKVGSKYVGFKVQTSGAVAIPGATVTCDGVSGTTDAAGVCYLTLTQSASGRAWSVSKTGYTTGTGTLAGTTPVATEAQTTSITVTLV